MLTVLLADGVLQLLGHGEVGLQRGEGFGDEGFDLRVGDFVGGFFEHFDGVLVVGDHGFGEGLVEVGAALGIGHLGFGLGGHGGFGGNGDFFGIGEGFELGVGFAVIVDHVLGEFFDLGIRGFAQGEFAHLHFRESALVGFLDEVFVGAFEIAIGGAQGKGGKGGERDSGENTEESRCFHK